MKTFSLHLSTLLLGFILSITLIPLVSSAIDLPGIDIPTVDADISVEIDIEMPTTDDVPEVDPDAPTIICDTFAAINETGVSNFDTDCDTSDDNNDGDDTGNDDTDNGDDGNGDDDGSGDGNGDDTGSGDDSDDDTDDSNNGGGTGSGSGSGTGTGTSGGSSSGGGGGGGIVAPTITISDEAVENRGEGTFVVTWTTNIPTTGWVAYGSASTPQAENEASPQYGYSNTSDESTIATTSHEAVLNLPASVTTMYFRPIANAGGTHKLGIELAIMPQVYTADGTVESCDQYLTSFIKSGTENDVQQVTRLQNFLREFEGFTEVVTNGLYDAVTLQAVHTFQERHRADILDPWGIENSSGFVYLTTRKKVNELYCKGIEEFPLTDSERAEVEGFKNRVQLAPAGTIDTSTVGTASPLKEEATEALASDDTNADQIAGAGAAVDTTGFFGTIGNFFKRLFGKGE